MYNEAEKVVLRKRADGQRVADMTHHTVADTVESNLKNYKELYSSKNSFYEYNGTTCPLEKKLENTEI